MEPDMVHSVRDFMPEMLRKQKVHYILHLVQPESFNSDVRIQNNKQAPSRDIAAHFSVIEHLHFVCEGSCYNDQMESCDKGLHDLYYSNEVQRFLLPSGVCDQFMFVKVNITELQVELNIEQLLHMDPPFHVNLHLSSLLDGKVQQFKAVMLYVLELVHTGDYIELQPPLCETAPKHH
eukprot:Em0001g2784a